ncbi:MAG: NUDIX hydrolase [Alphaproteobacteria bacterium]
MTPAQTDIESIRPVDLTSIDQTAFVRCFADCVVLTKDGKILLQQRPPDWGRSAGCLTMFGGHIEPGESPMQAIVRETKEELGADVLPSDVVSLGAVTEDFTDHTELVYGYFWHDKRGTITGCYECEAVYYDRIEGALAHPKIMDYVRWFLRECANRGLLKTTAPRSP